MRPETFAWIAAVCFAASHVASKRGLKTTSVLSGLLISLAVSVAVLAAAAISDPPTSVAATPTAIFALSGLIAPALARASAIAGVRRLGASIAVPIQASIYPLLAFLGGTFLLNEKTTSVHLVGVLLIVAGVALLGWTPSDARSQGPAARSTPRSRAASLVRTSGRRLAFPLLAGLCYASADVIRKGALETASEPTFAASVSATSALVGVTLAFATSRRMREGLQIGNTWAWFVVSGALSAAALVGLFHALSIGDVALVSPIIACEPLIVLVLAFFFLRSIETLRLTSIQGAAAVVAGTVLISI